MRFTHPMTNDARATPPLLMLVLLALVCRPALAQVDVFRQPATKNRPGAPPVAAAGNPTGLIANAEFVDAPITSIFKMISDLTGWSVLMSPSVSDKPPKINIWIKNLTPDQVLEQVGLLGRLVIQRQGNAVQVMTYDEYTKTYGVEKQVIALKNASAKDIAALLQPFADKDQAKVVAETGSNQLILLLPAPQMESMLALVEKLDVPFAKDKLVVIRLKHLEAPTVSRMFEEFLTQEARTGRYGGFSTTGSAPTTRPLAEAPGAAAPGSGASSGAATAQSGESQRAGQTWLVRFMIEPKLNAIILRGLADDVTRAAELVQQLDVANDLKVVGYQLQYTNAREAYQTINELIESDLRSGRTQENARPRLRVSQSEQNNRIVVEGAAEDHERVAKLIAAIDQPLPPGSGGIRVYRLENASSKEVAAVIREIVEQRDRNDRLARQERVTGAAPGYVQPASRRNGALTPITPAPVPAAAGGAPSAQASASLSVQAPAAGDVLPVRVTEAPEINAVVIRASAAEQEEFEAIIRQMDQPRDQVMLEVTLVTVRYTDDFNFGVELSSSRLGTTNALGFSNFGVGTADPNTGLIRIQNPAPFGLNFAVFNAGDFSVVLNALRTTGDTRITSVPKVLIQDNAKGTIKQINQEPYEVTSQGENSVVTSFGGFVEAGTTMIVTPHISKDDWLRLEYEVQLSSFGTRTPQQLAANLPPPRRESTSTGVIRVPAEHMVVLGGLTGTRDDEVIDRVPFIGDIPYLGELFKNRTHGKLRETLFIFIRPVVLRDPSFRDLLLLSDTERERAAVEPEQPVNPLKLLTPAEVRE